MRVTDTRHCTESERININLQVVNSWLFVEDSKYLEINKDLKYFEMNIKCGLKARATFHPRLHNPDI